MDDGGNGNIWYYLVLGIIYILSRVFGKKKKSVPKPSPKQTSREDIIPPTAEKSEAPAMSFEDILRELSGTPKPKPVTISEPEPESLYDPAYNTDEIDDIAVDYDVPDSFGENPYVKERPTSVASTRVQDTFTRSKNFVIEERITVDYLSALSDDEGPARAFVMSEIFARKY